MTDTTPESRSRQLLAELRQYTGDLERYRHSFNRRLIYTPGVKHLAEQAGAYWLLDAIASHVNSKPFCEALDQNPRLWAFQCWTLAVQPSGVAVLTAVSDRDEPPFIRQFIPFTDFPLEQIDLWVGWNGESWTLYLPSEH